MREILKLRHKPASMDGVQLYYRAPVRCRGKAVTWVELVEFHTKETMRAEVREAEYHSLLKRQYEAMKEGSHDA